MNVSPVSQLFSRAKCTCQTHTTRHIQLKSLLRFFLSSYLYKTKLGLNHKTHFFMALSSPFSIKLVRASSSSSSPFVFCIQNWLILKLFWLCFGCFSGGLVLNYEGKIFLLNEIRWEYFCSCKKINCCVRPFMVQCCFLG